VVQLQSLAQQTEDDLDGPAVAIEQANLVTLFLRNRGAILIDNARAGGF